MFNRNTQCLLGKLSAPHPQMLRTVFIYKHYHFTVKLRVCAYTCEGGEPHPLQALRA